MASPDLELQGAIVARLKARTALTAIVAQRIYDRPPTNAPFPYVEYGESQVIRDDVTCFKANLIYVTIHVWSQYSGGFKELKEVINEVVEALDDAPLVLPSHRLVSLTRQDTRHFKDPDEVTTHGVVEFVARVETPA
ncbi:DUF3168 domain-containing protein [Agrobacterium larrymoorei]|uniref:DUF3168 domain-containing protein n=1 Tax=Agrobacterium larrymoorei TaxID=160699 RepID=UPI0030BA3FAD